LKYNIPFMSSQVREYEGTQLSHDKLLSETLSIDKIWKKQIKQSLDELFETKILSSLAISMTNGTSSYPNFLRITNLPEFL